MVSPPYLYSRPNIESMATCQKQGTPHHSTGDLHGNNQGTGIVRSASSSSFRPVSDKHNVRAYHAWVADDFPESTEH